MPPAGRGCRPAAQPQPEQQQRHHDRQRGQEARLERDQVRDGEPLVGELAQVRHRDERPGGGAICGVSGTIGGSATCGPVMPASGSKPDAVSGGTPGGSDVGLIPGGSAPDAAVTISL